MEPTLAILPVATAPTTSDAKLPPDLAEAAYAAPPITLPRPLPRPVALAAAAFPTARIAIPARPEPPPVNACPAACVLFVTLLCPRLKMPPKAPPAAPAAVPIARPATISSASILPPVRPTLTPSPARKLSIFWLILRKATAHSSQIKILPATSVSEDAAIALWTSDSSKANAVEDSKVIVPAMVRSRIVFRFIGASLDRKRVCEEVADHVNKQSQAPGIHHQKEQLASQHSAPG